MPLQMVPTRRLHAVQRVMPVPLKAGFGTTLAAPLGSPLPADVGSLTVTDTGNGLTQSGGVLVVVPKGTPAWGDPAVWATASLARLCGRAAIGTWTFTVGTASKRVRIGWDTDQANFALEGLQLATDGCLALSGGTAGGTLFSAVVSTPYQVACVLRPTGYLLLVRGGVFTNWTLVWVSAALTTTPLFACATDNEATGTLDDFHVVDLPYPWSDPYAVAQVRLVTPAASITKYPMTADAVLEFTFTYSSATVGIDIRKVDGSNLWRCIATAGGALNFGEINAGVSTTTRINVAGVFTGTNTYRVVIVAVGNVYSVYVNDVLKGTYTDGTSFQTGITQFSVAFAPSNNISEVVAWPRSLNLPNAVGAFG